MRKFPLDENAVRTLANILDETGLTEIEVTADDHRIRVAKEPAQVAAFAAPAAPAPVAATPPPSPAAASTAEAAPATAVASNAVTSPMVGTVYLAAEPGTANFVNVGDTVKEGDTLLIIEAMKVMNTLPSPKSGKVTQILVQDAQPIEFGEPLVVIE